MAKPRLHLDADVSDANLEKELLKRGHDVMRTPNEWAASDADDETQLLGAAKRGRTILTFNARHFMLLAKKYQKHAGILLSKQVGLSRIFKALDRFFNESSTEEMEDQVRWLSDWEKRDD
ncbi:MAG: DUF5615 family PIN-like protein [Chloroflexota bacterium]